MLDKNIKKPEIAQEWFDCHKEFVHNDECRPAICYWCRKVSCCDYEEFIPLNGKQCYIACAYCDHGTDCTCGHCHSYKQENNKCYCNTCAPEY